MKKKGNIEIRPGLKEQAPEIASLIMEAMDYDCCSNFAGPDHTLDDFHDMMTELVAMEESQYSYRNTLTAMEGDTMAGCLVGYDGADLLRLRRAFIAAAKAHLERDFSDMAEETKAGEYYLDSLCVKSEFRKRGIATSLIREAIKRHGAPSSTPQPIGLLVDHTHPWAERLYKAIGFRVVEETSWGGHAMRHMQYPLRCKEFEADPLYLPYHDEEWGTPVHNDHDHFMYLLMESMSCGLSWKLILKKRDILSRYFTNFDAVSVAAYDEDDVRQLMHTEGMIHSERKIRAMINNAQCFLKVKEEFGTFDRYIWSFTDGQPLIYPSHQHTWVTRNALSDRVADDMRKRGFRYVGSVTIYSHLQGIGIINDHRCCCFRYKELMPSCKVMDERIL